MANPVESIFRFLAARPSIGDLVLNCTTTEVHGAEFEISQSPLEDGAKLSDHRLELPRMLRMEAILSPYPDNVDEPISLVTRVNPAMNYYRTAWAHIRAIASSNETFEVITDLEVYPSMTFFSYENTEQNEGVIRLQATLQQVEFGSVLRAKYLSPSFADVGGDSADVGHQGLAPT